MRTNGRFRFLKSLEKQMCLKKGSQYFLTSFFKQNSYSDKIKCEFCLEIAIKCITYNFIEKLKQNSLKLNKVICFYKKNWFDLYKQGDIYSSTSNIEYFVTDLRVRTILFVFYYCLLLLIYNLGLHLWQMSLIPTFLGF